MRVAAIKYLVQLEHTHRTEAGGDMLVPVDLSDTPYEGSSPEYGHTGKRSARERRGKYKANKVRRPSWRHNATLDVLLMTRSPSRKRAVRDAAATTTAPQAESYAARLARFGSVGLAYNEN